MSALRALRPFPVLFKLAFAEVVAYRWGLLVSTLSGIAVPLVMIAIWRAAAREAPVGRYDAPALEAYFLATFAVQQMTGSAIAVQMDLEVRQGTLSARLLRPFPPLLGFVLEGVAALPFRALVALPVIVLIARPGTHAVTHDHAALALLPVALLGAWTLGVVINLLIGCLSFFIERSAAVMHAYVAVSLVLSGATVPLDLFPERLRRVIDALPFRYQTGLGAEILTRAYDDDTGRLLHLLAAQWTLVALLTVAVIVLWRRGLRRYEAHGG